MVGPERQRSSQLKLVTGGRAGYAQRAMNEVLYGRQAVLETLRARRRRVRRVVLREGARPSPELGEIRALARQAGARVESASWDALRELCGSPHSQSVAAEVSGYPYASVDELVPAAAGKGEDALVLLLDHVQDPQNLGALLRVADVAGAHGVVLPEHRSAHVTPAVVRASAGAAEHVRVAVVKNLVRGMETLKQQGLWLAGFELSERAALYTETDLTGPVGIVLGSEGGGMRRLVGCTCDFWMKLPMFGRVSSLNVAAAGAVALYEVRRQRAAQAEGA